MCSGVPATGWTLGDARWELPSSLLRAEYDAAKRRWENEGRPGAAIILRGSGAEIMESHIELSRCREDLEKDVLSKLISGALYAVGRAGNANAAPERIRSECWKYMQVSSWDDSRAVLEGSPPVLFFEIRVFDPFDSPAKRTARSLAEAKAKCLEWLAAHMNASKDVKAAPKAVWRQRALKLFPGLTNRAFDSVWSSAIDETGCGWDRRGRPPKTPH